MVISRILDLIYPPSLYCICCNKIIDDTRTYALCNDCMDSIKWIDNRSCAKCGKPLSDNNPGRICFNCIENEHEFNNGFTCTEYGEHERNIIFSLKYDGNTYIANIIAEIMFDRIKAEFYDSKTDSFEAFTSRYDIVTSVPIHKKKREVRGFNQAELIAKKFAEKIKIEYSSRLIERIKETHTMRALGPDARKENIRGAFKIASSQVPPGWRSLPWFITHKPSSLGSVKGKSILLVDDIYTTGATIDEIASVLKAEGARKVDFITFSSGADIIKSNVERNHLHEMNA